MPTMKGEKLTREELLSALARLVAAVASNCGVPEEELRLSYRANWTKDGAALWIGVEDET